MIVADHCSHCSGGLSSPPSMSLMFLHCLLCENVQMNFVALLSNVTKKQF